jgi:osmoprotectant transport system ATP-binding protein
LIEFSNVSKTYQDGTKALHNISFTAEEGELLTLIGPSGSGKTTTMKMINRLIHPTSGTIKIQNKEIKDYDIHKLRWNIGYVLQEIALFPHMNIEENISIVPEMKGWKKQNISKRIDELMEMVGLDPKIFRKRRPNELSGGQQQRVGVIRALAADPDILLMDEPFSSLDPISREQIQKDIRELQQKIKKTIVFVTHDMDEAMALGDRVCLMKEGEIVQLAPPQQLILHPANGFVKKFIGERKSPWLTAVDVMVEKNRIHILKEQDIINGNIPLKGTYVVENQEGKYLGAFLDGRVIELPPLSNDLNLQHAIAVFDEHEAHLLPVVKGEKLIGTLSYKDIVHYLQVQRIKENGVIYE